MSEPRPDQPNSEPSDSARDPYRGLSVQEMPAQQRPREKLLAFGPEHLDNHELLAILLGTGLRGRHVLDVAQSLLNRYGLAGLLRADPKQLLHEPGLGPAKIASIVAAVHLGSRAAREQIRGAQITKPEQVWNLYGPDASANPQEQVRVLALNRQHRIIHDPIVYQGTAHSAQVRIAELLKPAIVRDAASIILVHNHPSGDPHPSAADIDMTATLQQAAQLHGIDLIDHIILGAGNTPFASLKHLGHLD